MAEEEPENAAASAPMPVFVAQLIGQILDTEDVKAPEKTRAFAAYAARIPLLKYALRRR